MQLKKILIIEDEISIANILKFKLEKADYITKSAKNGKDGLKQLSSFNPDLILLDLQLPDMCGFEICKKIKDNFQKPVIILTAKNTNESKKYGKKVGADDYITKPFNIDILLDRITTILETSSCCDKIAPSYKIQQTIQPTDLKNQVSINEIAHELKTPLTIILGYTQLLRAESNNSVELYQIALDNIELESRNLLDATEKVISLAKERTFC